MRTILSTWSKFSLFLTMMEQDTNLRSQVIQATDLLLKAVERLEGRPASPSVSRAMSGPSDSLSICRPSVSRVISGPSDSLSICRPSVSRAISGPSDSLSICSLYRASTI